MKILIFYIEIFEGRVSPDDPMVPVSQGQC